MRITRWTTLGLGVVAGAVVTYVAMAVLDRMGASVPAVSLSVGVVLFAGALVLVGLGWPVRQFIHGKRKEIDPLRAARTLALAKACCAVGSLLTGGYGVLLAQSLGHLISPLLQQRAWAAGVAVFGAACLMVAGLIVQYFCRIPPEEPEEPGRATTGLADPPQDPHPA